MLMRVAWELGKTVDEIKQLSPTEFGNWVAFFQIQDDARKKAQTNRSGIRGRSRRR